MYIFLKEKMLNLLYGEKFEVTAENAKVWIEVDNALTGFPSKSIPTTIVTGDGFYMFGMVLQPQQCWADTEMLERGINNLIVPDVVLQYFKEGGTLEEIDNYKTVLKYGMLYGKKRRLVIL